MININIENEKISFKVINLKTKVEVYNALISIDGLIYLTDGDRVYRADPSIFKIVSLHIEE